MIVNTHRLFLRMLSVLRIDLICDIGSMDGADAVRFRARAPRARIFAFEAHPGNFLAMQQDPRLKALGIEAVPFAITREDGEADFFMVGADYVESRLWRGMSSLHRRMRKPQRLTRTRVRTARLDTFLREKSAVGARIALWVDVEGNAYEALEGADTTLGSTQLLHVEVESVPCIGERQKCHREVEALLVAAGFRRVATDAPLSQTQFNALFVRRALPPRAHLALQYWLLQGLLRRYAGRAARIMGLTRFKQRTE